MKNTNIKPRKPSHLLAARDQHHLWLTRAGIFLASFLLTTGVVVFEFPSEMARQEFVIGEPASRTFFAPFEVAYVDEQATEAIRQQRVFQTPPVFDLQPNVTAGAQSKTADFFNQIGPVPIYPALPLPPELAFETFKILGQEWSFQEAQKAMGLLQEKMVKEGILESPVKNNLLNAGVKEIVVWGKDGERRMFLAEVLSPQDFEEALAKSVSSDIWKNRDFRSALLTLAQTLLKPNLGENIHETKASQKKAAHSVEPVLERIQKEELIIQRGILITQKARERLIQVQKKLAAHKVINKISASALLVFLSYFLSFLYLLFFEKKAFTSPKLLLLIHMIYLLNLVICKTIALWPGSSYYLMPTALSSVLTSLLIGPRIGLMTAAVMATLVAPLTDFSAEVILVTLIASSAGTFASLQLRKRIQFLRLGAAIGLASFFMLLITRMFQEYSFVESFQVAGLGLAKGLLVTMPLAFLLLPILEMIFNVTTDITLLELSDLNHPLLKRMIIEAPGTYHHSLVVSTLAESACETIGANALLARVGCYFHDIGKIARAEFFTENSQNHNRHEKLAPTMSCLIIMNHVKDGLELGRKYKLKEPILRFIPEHQGTGIIYFFYRKAMDNAKPGKPVYAEDFRYPGPKPQSRETAVALLSDSLEASSRSLQHPSPESIRQLVRKIINDKFIDGQLDECDLTLRDLYKIQESFVRNLVAIFHTRVKYPSPLKEENRPDLFEEGQFEKYRSHSERSEESC